MHLLQCLPTLILTSLLILIILDEHGVVQLLLKLRGHWQCLPPHVHLHDLHLLLLIIVMPAHFAPIRRLLMICCGDRVLV